MNMVLRRPKSSGNTDTYKRHSMTLFTIVLGALLIRLTIMLAWETYRFPDEKSFGAEMGWIAHNLAEGNGFIVGGLGTTVYYAWMAPLFPFILSWIFSLFGSYSISSALAILAIQSIVSSLLVIPLYLIAEDIFDRKVALITAILWTFHPGSIIFATQIVWSSSFTALGLTTALWLVLRLQKNPLSKTGALICGLVIGLTTLSDPTAIAIAPAAALWLIWRSRNSGHLRETTGQLMLIALSITVVITPWTIRNYYLFDQFVPIKSTFGVNLWQGNHSHDINQPTAGLSFANRVEDHFSEDELNHLISLNEIERASFFRDEAIEFIVANPATFAHNTIWRIYLFWRHFALQIGGIFLLLYYLLVAFAFIRSKQLQTYLMLFLLFFATFPIPYYLTIADTYRYRFPIESFLLVPLAFSLQHLAQFAYALIDKVSADQRRQT